MIPDLRQERAVHELSELLEPPARITAVRVHRAHICPCGVCTLWEVNGDQAQLHRVCVERLVSTR